MRERGRKGGLWSLARIPRPNPYRGWEGRPVLIHRPGYRYAEHRGILLGAGDGWAVVERYGEPYFYRLEHPGLLQLIEQEAREQ